MLHRLARHLLILATALFVAIPTVNPLGDESETKWKAPAEAAKVENPYPPTAAILKNGEKLFTQQCTPCHGASGKGDGPAGKYLGKPLPDFTKPEFQKQSDGALFWKVSQGNAPMPTFEQILSEEQRWAVIDYLRTFGPTKEQGGNK